MLTALMRHWPEYLIEAAGLGIFMIVACLATALLELPASPVRQAIADPVVRRESAGRGDDGVARAAGLVAGQPCRRSWPLG
jgi:hypothetical protein